jgi:solute carrier family 8 (sodium/calcium exchanger)
LFLFFFNKLIKGNVTGSNSVNVFLGLGLPWVIASIYWTSQGLPFTVKAGSITFSVGIFTIVSLIGLGILFLRRRLKCLGGGELGGPSIPKYLSAALYLALWAVYILLSTLQAYDIIKV